MATLLEIQAIAMDPVFRTRVRIATLKAAGAILADNTRNDEYRWCQSVLENPDSNEWLSDIVYQVALNPTINSTVDANGLNNSPDADIEFAVNSVIEKFSKPVN